MEEVHVYPKWRPHLCVTDNSSIRRERDGYPVKNDAAVKGRPTGGVIAEAVLFRRFRRPLKETRCARWHGELVSHDRRLRTTNSA